MQGPAELYTSQGYVLDVVPLLRYPGNRCQIRLDDSPTELSITSASAVRLAGGLVAESMVGSLSIAGSLDVTWEGECRRCCEVARGVATVGVQEIFESVPTEGETYQLSYDHLDLEPMVRELVLLGLPLAPLCRASCDGPAPLEFPAMVTTESNPPVDSRWAELDKLSFDFDEESK